MPSRNVKLLPQKAWNQHFIENLSDSEEVHGCPSVGKSLAVQKASISSPSPGSNSDVEDDDLV